VVARLLRDDPAGVVPWLAEHALSPRAAPAVRRGFLASGDVTPPDVARADFDVVRATDMSARLAAIACPITWLDGADDRIVAAAGERPGEIITVPAAGHLLPIEAPGAVAEAIARAVG
jgi:pimeloyl-ACP methyl ester carboxylesterase